MKNLMNPKRLTHRYIALLVVFEGIFPLFHFPWCYLPDTVRRPGRGAGPPPPPNAEVLERVELYIYSP